MKIDFDTFKRSYLVVGLSEPDIKKVMDLATVGEVKNGHEIVKLGTREPDIYIILSGICKVVRKGGALLGTCGVGSVIGEVALLDDQPRSASVVAKGRSLLSWSRSLAWMRSLAAWAASRSPAVEAPAKRLSILRSLSFSSASVVMALQWKGLYRLLYWLISKRR